MKKSSAWQIALRYLNPFNGNSVSVAVCWALFSGWFILGYFLIPMASASAAIDSYGISILSSAITHLMGFIPGAKVILALLAPVLVLGSRSNLQVDGFLADFRFILVLFVVALLGNAVDLMISMSGFETTQHLGMLASYVSIPVLMYLWLLLTWPYALLILIVALSLQFLGVVIHEYRVVAAPVVDPLSKSKS